MKREREVIMKLYYLISSFFISYYPPWREDFNWYFTEKCNMLSELSNCFTKSLNGILPWPKMKNIQIWRLQKKNSNDIKRNNKNTEGIKYLRINIISFFFLQNILDYLLTNAFVIQIRFMQVVSLWVSSQVFSWRKMEGKGTKNMKRNETLSIDMSVNDSGTFFGIRLHYCFNCRSVVEVINILKGGDDKKGVIKQTRVKWF